ncbi:hypothetical protein [Nisaea denitrificans]|uniref:hypothetical protein n=1 Tax=Nisaea denitrificans TaxID=390877 RepID=UPI0004183DD4|nr:hypothetical protein [Nisaea denitrificans]
MTSVSSLSSLTKLQVAQPRVVGQEATSKSSASSSSSPTYRTAETGNNLFSASISDGDRTTAGLQELLGGELEKLFGALDRKNDPDGSVSRALDSLKDLLGKAGEDSSVSGFQIRISSVSQQLRTDDGGGDVFSSVSQLSIEVGLVRDGKVAAEDVELLSFEGKKLPLTDTQKQTGIITGRFVLDDPATSSKAQETAADQALERLKLVSDALAAFRRGDLGPLQNIESLFRGGTLDAESVRALSSAKDVTKSAVFPGSGILDV